MCMEAFSERTMASPQFTRYWGYFLVRYTMKVFLNKMKLFSEFSEFRESDESLNHALGSI